MPIHPHTQNMIDNMDYWTTFASLKTQEEFRIKFSDEGQRELFIQDLLLWKGFVLSVIGLTDKIDRLIELAELTKK